MGVKRSVNSGVNIGVHVGVLRGCEHRGWSHTPLAGDHPSRKVLVGFFRKPVAASAAFATCGCIGLGLGLGLGAGAGVRVWTRVSVMVSSWRKRRSIINAILPQCMSRRRARSIWQGLGWGLGWGCGEGEGEGEGIQQQQSLLVYSYVHSAVMP